MTTMETGDALQSVAHAPESSAGVSITAVPGGSAWVPDSASPEETYRLHRRFDRMGRLVGDEAMKRLLGAHVIVVGLGGVGSWAAESLVRSGVGRLTLVDFDEVCITNFNRQLQAVQGQVGQKKADVLAERFAKIHPQARITALAEPYCERTEELIFAERPDFVVDAIDNVTNKCRLIAYCRREGIPIVVSTGSGGRMDPTRIRLADLAETENDPLAREIRRILRQEHGFSREGRFDIPAVYSQEPTQKPVDLAYDNGQGFKCVCPQGNNGFFTCDNRNLILGNASFVTGAFGLAAASYVVRTLTGAGPDASS